MSDAYGQQWFRREQWERCQALAEETIHRAEEAMRSLNHSSTGAERVTAAWSSMRGAAAVATQTFDFDDIEWIEIAFDDDDEDGPSEWPLLRKFGFAFEPDAEEEEFALIGNSAVARRDRITGEWDLLHIIDVMHAIGVEDRSDRSDTTVLALARLRDRLLALKKF